MREIIFGDEHDSGGFLVEAVNDARPQRIAGLRKSLTAAEERVNERAGGISRASVDGHARGFVDDDDVVIFIQDSRVE